MRLVLLAILPLGLIVVGISALVRGLRGRRIDDHPLCRRCGFDLTGKPETSTRCPECGSDLRRPRAILDNPESGL
jgi:tRNA(Ile2) C34 agmatinyltransferase TiaS